MSKQRQSESGNVSPYPVFIRVCNQIPVFLIRYLCDIMSWGSDICVYTRISVCDQTSICMCVQISVFAWHIVRVFRYLTRNPSVHLCVVESNCKFVITICLWPEILVSMFVCVWKLVLVLDISMECLNKKVNYVGNMNLNVMNIFCNFSMSSIGEPFLWHFLTFHTIMSLYLMGVFVLNKLL